MTVPAPLAFPGGRTLAGWWRQLAHWQPRALWVGHLFLHRVEALVHLDRSLRPDALHSLVLRAISRNSDESLESLDQRLYLGQQVLGRVMRSLSEAGLLTTEGGRPVPTESGREVLARGDYHAMVHERQVFYFAEPRPPNLLPHFLPLQGPTCVPLSAPEGWRFDGRWLADCVAQSVDWKRRFGFPAEVKEVFFDLDRPSVPGFPQPWQRVILDRAERLPIAVALAVRPEGGDRLLGFAVRQESWTLLAQNPTFAIEDAWQAAFPSLVEGPSPGEWEEAWRTWCQPRGLAAGDVNRLQPEGHLLRVNASAKLLERLRAARSDALKGEAWLLAGSGRLRAAAQLEIVEPEPQPALRQA